jgi:hypothetical protein
LAFPFSPSNVKKRVNRSSSSSNVAATQKDVLLELNRVAGYAEHGGMRLNPCDDETGSSGISRMTAWSCR